MSVFGAQTFSVELHVLNILCHLLFVQSNFSRADYRCTQSKYRRMPFFFFIVKSGGTICILGSDHMKYCVRSIQVYWTCSGVNTCESPRFLRAHNTLWCCSLTKLCYIQVPVPMYLQSYGKLTPWGCVQLYQVTNLYFIILYLDALSYYRSWSFSNNSFIWGICVEQSRFCLIKHQVLIAVYFWQAKGWTGAGYIWLFELDRLTSDNVFKLAVV